MFVAPLSPGTESRSIMLPRPSISTSNIDYRRPPPVSISAKFILGRSRAPGECDVAPLRPCASPALFLAAGPPHWESASRAGGTLPHVRTPSNLRAGTNKPRTFLTRDHARQYHLWYAVRECINNNITNARYVWRLNHRGRSLALAQVPIES